MYIMRVILIINKIGTHKLNRFRTLACNDVNNKYIDDEERKK